MVHLEIEFSGMIAFDLRKKKDKRNVALLLAGSGAVPHLPVVAIPRSAVDREGIPRAFRQPEGWPQGLAYGGSEQLLFGLTGFDLRVAGAASSKASSFAKVWDLVTLNKLSHGDGVIQCGAEAGRVTMSGGLLKQGKAYPPFDKRSFALKREGKILPRTTKKLTNTMHWSGDAASIQVWKGDVDCGPIVFKNPASKAAKVKIEVYSLTAAGDVDRDSLNDFLDFYSLLSKRPGHPAQLVEMPEVGVMLEGFPRCIPPVTIL